MVELEKAVQRMSALPCSLAANFSQNGPTLVRVGSTTAEQASGSRTKPSSDVVPTASFKILQQEKKQGRSYSKDITHTLKTWLESHTECPYPTPVEKQQLINLTGLSKGALHEQPHLNIHLLFIGQINAWFNYHRRKLNTRTPQIDEDEMLFSKAPTDEPWDDEDIDLLSQPVDDSSLYSEASQSSSTTISVSQPSTPRTTDINEFDEQGPELSVEVAEKLLDGVLQVFIGGYYRKIRLPPGVNVEQPVPETCLSQLVPNIFNPGYREV